MRLPEEERQHAMLQLIDGGLAERPLGGIDALVQSLVGVVAEAADVQVLHEAAVVQLVDVNRLVLDGEDGERAVVQVEALVVRQVDLVDAKVDAIGDAAGAQVDQIEGEVLQRTSYLGGGVRADARASEEGVKRLVIAVTEWAAFRV